MSTSVVARPSSPNAKSSSARPSNKDACGIKKHIHPDYTLAAMIRKGIAFHYGKMPTFLREALESAFREGHVKFLVCTTTLFEGINLPARNVFIDTPRGARGSR
jgi:replicative superfamily II helicase